MSLLRPGVIKQHKPNHSSTYPLYLSICQFIHTSVIHLPIHLIDIVLHTPTSFIHPPTHQSNSSIPHSPTNHPPTHLYPLTHPCLRLPSSRLQAIPLFKAYRLRTSILGMIQTAMGHHYNFEFVL